MTNVDTGAVPTAENLITIAEKVLQGVEDHAGLINSIGGMAGVLPETSLVLKAVPLLIAVLQFMGGETGKPPLEVFRDFLSHNTPGMPNAPSLSFPQGS